jgi:hypothetical protein
MESTFIQKLFTITVRMGLVGLARSALSELKDCFDWEMLSFDLAIAVKNKDINMVSMLLDMGVNPDGPYGTEFAMHEAVRGGCYDIIRLMVKRGARPPSMLVAISNNDVDLISTLLDMGHVFTQEDLECAICYRQFDLVKLIIYHPGGARLNYTQLLDFRVEPVHPYQFSKPECDK